MLGAQCDLDWAELNQISNSRIEKGCDIYEAQVPVISIWSRLRSPSLLLAQTQSPETMSNPSETRQTQRFGLLWPDLNDGLSYNDVVRSSDSGLSSSSLISYRLFIYNTVLTSMTHWNFALNSIKSKKKKNFETVFVFVYSKSAQFVAIFVPFVFEFSINQTK